MSDRAGPAIPPLPSIHDVSRDTLPSASFGWIRRGAWNKADVILAVTREGRFVVKDYAAKPWPVRAAGRLQLRREERAYRALEGVRGVPRLARRIDRDAVAVEHVEGLRMAKFHRFRRTPALVASLEGILREIHARGVVHNDIRSRDNLLVTPAGGLYLIDFSSAMTFGGSGWRRRLLMPLFEAAEGRAFLKWKSKIAPEAMTEEERASHRRFSRVRRLWPFNPKQDLEVKRSRAGRKGGA